MTRFFRGIWLVVVLAATANVSDVHGAITFTSGHFYSANAFSKNIIEYDPAGKVVGSVNIALADEVRGITFGIDGLLYVTAADGGGFKVLSFDASGALRETYPMPSIHLGGAIYYGKIAVDAHYIYVAGNNQIIRFEIGAPASGTSIYTNSDVVDVEILPSGNLLAASSYEVNEITASGSFIRSIALQGNGPFVDIRGVEYDPSSNNLFVTMLGHTGFSFQLLRIDGTSGVLEESVSFHYGADLFLTSSGSLLVGSDAVAPRIYTQDLDATGTLGAESRNFVTQFPTAPEPSTAVLLSAGGLMLLTATRKRRTNAAV